MIVNDRPALPYRRTLIALLVLIGVNAIVAGYSFVTTPDGSAMGIPQEWLSDSPFTDYCIPGILLFSLGVLHLIGAYLEWRRVTAASRIALISGMGLIIWIVTQAAMMGSFRHPAQTILQAVCLVAGITTSLLALKQER